MCEEVISKGALWGNVFNFDILSRKGQFRHDPHPRFLTGESVQMDFGFPSLTCCELGWNQLALFLLWYSSIQWTHSRMRARRALKEYRVYGIMHNLLVLNFSTSLLLSLCINTLLVLNWYVIVLLAEGKKHVASFCL